MNVNEVIANRCIQLVGGVIGPSRRCTRTTTSTWGSRRTTTFPTAMHVAAVQVVRESVVPDVAALRDAIADKAALWRGVVKIGRTHLEDAVPLTVGQGVVGYTRQLTRPVRLERSSVDLYELARRGRRSAPAERAARVRRRAGGQDRRVDRVPVVTAPNKFAALGGADATAALRRAARARRALAKIATTSAGSGQGRGPGSASDPAATSPGRRSCRAR